MRTASTAIAAAFAGLLTAGTAAADSADPNQPGGPPRAPGSVATPDLAPRLELRPPVALPRRVFTEALMTSFEVPTLDADGDAEVDQMLGVLPGPEAEKEHATIIIDGQCWDLDTLLPEKC